MGQSNSGPIVNLSCNINGFVSDQEETKLKRTLRTLSDEPENSRIVEAWENATKKFFRTSIEKWGLLTFAIGLLETWGKYRLMATFAMRQIELAHDISEKEKCRQDKPNAVSNTICAIIVADSYLSLSRVNLLASHYNKAVDYARKCLEHLESIRGACPQGVQLRGYAYLCTGSGYIGLSNFKRAMEYMEKCLTAAHLQSDKALECLACCAVGTLYLEVKDYEKATFFPTQAAMFLAEHGSRWNKRFRITTQLCLAVAYRKVGKLDEAMSTCEDLMQFSLEEQDRRAQAYCMLCFADIHRVRKDAERALPRYESALGLMIEIGDRYGQTQTAIGKAKAYLRSKDFEQALQQYSTGMQLAESIGNKMSCLRIHGELAVLYQRMSDQERARESTLRYHRLLEALDLFCGVCAEPIGEKHEQLQALPCSHIFHLRCVSEHGLLDTLACPNCKQVATKPTTL